MRLVQIFKYMFQIPFNLQLRIANTIRILSSFDFLNDIIIRKCIKSQNECETSSLTPLRNKVDLSSKLFHNFLCDMEAKTNSFGVILLG